MYIRLLISFSLLVIQYIHLFNPTYTTPSFYKIETFLTVLFLYLDQPLIVGATLTIVAVYYRVSVKRYQRDNPELTNVMLTT